ncbi:beta transducin [Fusarium beomiforme]|uniref:Beta transducin n=1 Tax=Fusarium beomiforme TaxID=44412 RepID=A0A9P5DXB8_9HYPO|nr:beta transducin [Fusarium beomiforme]
MRLINVENLTLETFIGEKIPPYAILSHRWGNDDQEVTFNDMIGGNTDKVGMKKVEGCCRQAKKDDLKYAWIDSCCINKESSKELDEAINSMFQWYRRAAVCYTYMVDVSLQQDIWDTKSNFFTSSWFTRGWTLQELLAPSELRFYDQTWAPIGTKEDLVSEIEDITGIPRKFLLGWVDFHQASVAQRMSWASKRTTKREEDIAYCLLGIFNVTMPMIYGEGHKAFERLQLKIMEQTTDDSILAWGVKVQGMEVKGQTDRVENSTSAGIFASSPADFAKCGRIVPRTVDSTSVNTFSVSGGYIRTSLKLQSSENGMLYGLLNCGLEGYREGVIAIPLHRTSFCATFSDCIRPQGYGPILCKSEIEQNTQKVRIRVERQSQPAQPVGKQIWLHIDGHQKFKLHLIEAWPPLEWDKGRALVVDAQDRMQPFSGHYLLRFRLREGHGNRDIIVVLKIDGTDREESADCFMLATSTFLQLQSIKECLEYMHPEDLRDKIISSGTMAVKIVVQKEDIAQGSIFLLRLAQTDERPPPDSDSSDKIEKAIEVAKFVLCGILEECSRLKFRRLTQDQVNEESSIASWHKVLDGVAEKERQLAEERKRVEREIVEAQERLRSTELSIENVRMGRDKSERDREESRETLDDRERAEGSGNWLETLIQSQLDKQKALQGKENSGSSGSTKLPSAGLVNSEQNMGGFIPLLWAAANGKDYFARLLLERGAAIEAKESDNGDTALILAARYGHRSMVELLLQFGAKINVRSAEGDTALAVAAHRGHASLVQYLIEVGADIELRNINGNTPLAIAARKGNEDVIRVLLDQGANIEVKNRWGDTPLSRAASNGHQRVVAMLIETGAKVDGKNRKGLTPLQLAEKQGETEVVEMLRALQA